MKANRREFIALSLAAITPGAEAQDRDLTVTPPQTAGPFYPDQLPIDADNNLIQIEGRARVAKGTPADVIGSVLDRTGNPIPGAKVEIWQCDANGRYHHDGDYNNPADADDDFQAYGSTTTDDLGRYRFLTIRPVPYPGRTPHIHFRITAPGAIKLTTQLYIADHPANEHDGIFSQLGSKESQLASSAQFLPNPDTGNRLLARWDIVMG